MPVSGAGSEQVTSTLQVRAAWTILFMTVGLGVLGLGLLLVGKSRKGSRQLGGRLELRCAGLPRPRLEGHGLSDLQFRSPPVTARAR